MKTILKLEEAAQLLVAAYLAMQLPFAGWVYWALFLTPDISMLGYLVNTRTGAFTYNLVHHKGVALIIYLVGLIIASTVWQFVGLFLFGHSAFDRIFGYDLKYNDSFKNTHLGWIGK
jgi:Domain of unknown function (DUF4260)